MRKTRDMWMSLDMWVGYTDSVEIINTVTKETKLHSSRMADFLTVHIHRTSISFSFDILCRRLVVNTKNPTRI